MSAAFSASTSFSRAAALARSAAASSARRASYFLIFSAYLDPSSPFFSALASFF